MMQLALHEKREGMCSLQCISRKKLSLKKLVGANTRKVISAYVNPKVVLLASKKTKNRQMGNNYILFFLFMIN